MTRITAARKIAELNSRCARVRELLPPTEAAFLADRMRAEATVLNLYLALQAASDLALHAIGELGLGLAPDARTAHVALGRSGVVTPEMAARLAAAVGLRNRIAHEYGTLDLSRVYEVARDDLGDLEAFARALSTVLLAAPRGAGGE
jgi:uncharacterized protein YutE (UPF0331/DUF86 family)